MTLRGLWLKIRDIIAPLRVKKLGKIPRGLRPLGIFPRFFTLRGAIISLIICQSPRNVPLFLLIPRGPQNIVTLYLVVVVIVVAVDVVCHGRDCVN